MDTASLLNLFFITASSFIITYIIHKPKVDRFVALFIIFLYLALLFIMLFIEKLPFIWSIATGLGLIIIKYVLRDPLPKQLFSYLSSLLFLIIIKEYSFRISLLTKLPIYLPLLVILSIYLFLIVIKRLASEYRTIYQISNNGRWYIYCIFPAMCILFYVICPHIIPVNRNVYGNIFMLIIYMLVLFIYHLLFFSIKRTYKDVIKLNENAELQRFLHRQIEYNQHIIEARDQVRQLKHNERFHLLVLYDLIKDNNVEAAEEYLKRMITSIEKIGKVSTCDNLFLDCLLSSYIEQAERQNICMRTEIQIDQDIPFEIIDICSIFGNCIENAIESCMRSKSEVNNEVYIGAKVKNDSLIINFRNSFSHSLVFEKQSQIPISTKDSGGLGLKSVQYTVEKYSGDFHIDVCHNTFSIFIRLPIDMANRSFTASRPVI